MHEYYINYKTNNYLIDYNKTPYIIINGYTKVDEKTYRIFEKEQLEITKKEKIMNELEEENTEEIKMFVD